MGSRSRNLLAGAAAVVVASAATGAATGQAAELAPISPVSTVVSAGFQYACAVTGDGGVLCWGDNYQGVLGTGDRRDRRTPTAVEGLPSGVQSVATRRYLTCALTDPGGVKCWGFGYVGDGSSKRRTSPVDVIGLETGVASVAVGTDSACALTDGGGVKCWGLNGNGELGDGTTRRRASPVDVIGLQSGVVQVGMGGNHACAVTDVGAIWCWGGNERGQLGDGSTDDSATPVQVSGVTEKFAEVSAGTRFTCAVTAGGSVMCWGGNRYGQLGDGTRDWRPHPAPVADLSVPASVVSAGGAHACALTTSGGARCWGHNPYGEVGDGTVNNDRLTPGPVVGTQSDSALVTAGTNVSCLLTEAGAARCWGSNFERSLGDGSNCGWRRQPITVWGLAGSSGAFQQPDLAISRSRQGPYRGNDVYNTTAVSQTLNVVLRSGHTKSWFVRLANDGDVPDRYSLEVSYPWHRRFSVNYFMGDRNITSAAGRCRLAVPLEPGERTLIRIAITTTPSAGAGHTVEAELLAKSFNDSSHNDMVMLVAST